MAAISQTINNVLGGVSQQPDPVKLPGQVREAVNAYLDPTFGCSKRPGTQFIGLLAGDVPESAKWFPIFHSENERYVACIYVASGQPTIRCWDANTANESTVTILGDSDYLLGAVDAVDQFRTLTINDFTFIINREKTVTMDTAESEQALNKALIVVNSVAYNTAYTVDFLQDGTDLEQQKIYKASALSVTPASWEVVEQTSEDPDDTPGGCQYAFTESFVEDGTGTKTGLGFTISTTCSPTLDQKEVEGELFPTRIEFGGSHRDFADYGFNAYATDEFGFADSYSRGSYLYLFETAETVSGEVTVRIEFRVEAAAFDTQNRENTYQISKIEVVEYDSTGQTKPWAEGLNIQLVKTLPNDYRAYEGAAGVPNGSTAGISLVVTDVKRGEPTYEYTYKSVYRSVVTLNNGGANWEVGDTLQVTMQGKQYEITVDQTAFGYGFAAEATATFTTPADTTSGPLDVGTIVSNLTSEVNALDNYDATPIGNVVVITRNDGRDFNIQARGGTANAAIYAVKSAVNDVSRLPAQCEDGFVLKVSNSQDSDADDYFVKFKTEGSIPGQGSWVETVKPGVATSLNASTMPHVLEREDSGQFIFKPLSPALNDKNFWAPRDAGDEKTNPDPTFVGQTLTDMVFYMNRLGFLSGSSVVLSQAGDYFNFFQGSAIAISDADPIDMGVSTTKPATLKAAVGTPAGLLLFAENSQFLLKSQDVAFAPSTVKMDEITNYAYRSAVQPVETGVSILFPTSADTFSKVFELSVDSLNSRPLITENTRIIPEYIPPDLTWCHSVPNSSLVLMGTGNDMVYAFKFYNTGNERNLAGWTKWQFNSDIKLVSFDHDTGFFVQRNASDQTFLARMELLDDPETSPIRAAGSTFTPRIDNFIFENETTITDIDTLTMRVRFPTGFYAGEDPVYVVATDDGVETFFTQAEVQTDATGDYIEIQKNIKGSDFIVGLRYEFSVTLPQFFVKEGDGNRADRRFPPMVENMYLDLYLSGQYSVDIEKLGYITRSVDLDVLRADIYQANTSAVTSFDTRAIPIFSRGDLATVTIKSPDPMPAALTSYSWEGHYSTRGIARR